MDASMNWYSTDIPIFDHLEGDGEIEVRSISPSLDDELRTLVASEDDETENIPGIQSITKPFSDQTKEMEQLHQTAGIYHNIWPNQIKESANDFFNSVNIAGGEEKAKLREFLSFRTADRFTLINNRPLLKDGNTGRGGVYCSIM